jgi:hypothetical protein
VCERATFFAQGDMMESSHLKPQAWHQPCSPGLHPQFEVPEALADRPATAPVQRAAYENALLIPLPTTAPPPILEEEPEEEGGDDARPKKREKPLVKMNKAELSKKAADMGIEVGLKRAVDLRKEIEDEIKIQKREEERLNSDPFLRVMKDCEIEHSRQITLMKQENAALKQRLDAVLSATWNLSKGKTGGVEGSSPGKGRNQSELGALELVCAPPGSVNQMMWTVSEDDRTPDNSKTDIGGENATDSGKAKRKTWHLRQAYNSLEATVQDNPFDEFGRAKTIARTSVDSCATGASVTALETYLNREGFERYIVSPTSTERLAWDLVGTVLLFYDSITIPLSFFDPIDGIFFFLLMDWVTLLFWSCDMVSQFFTGYIGNGTTIMSPGKIAAKYLKTWFVLDIGVLGPDWIFTILSLAYQGTGEAVVNPKMLRTLRISRGIRLLRAGKMKRLLRRIEDKITSESTFLAFSVIQLLIAVIFFNHLLASAFYLIGDIYKTSDSKNWIEASRIDGRSVMFRYTTSLYWSLANFALSGPAILPANSGEASYASVVLLVGLCFFVIFVSMTTKAMVQLESSKDEMSKQLWLVRRFFHQKKVPRSLAYRTLHYLEYKVATTEAAVTEARLEVLAMLSDSLSLELKFSVSFTMLRQYPPIEAAERMSDHMLYRIAGVACCSKHFAKEDNIFKFGLVSAHMHYSAGNLIYTKKDRPHPIDVESGDWLVEQTLWVDGWTCRGSAVATAETEVIQIDGKILAERAHDDAQLWSLMTGYAEQFLNWLQETEPQSWTDFFFCDTSRAVSQDLVSAAVARIAEERERERKRLQGSVKKSRRTSLTEWLSSGSQS